jgi:hypothetical protein
MPVSETIRQCQRADLAYEHATGTGTFDNVPAGFKGANLYNGTFDVKTP